MTSLSPATGTEFSVLPAQNATGNWVKVVQRVPIRLAVQMPADAPPLRTGMSATVEIDTGHRRALGDLVETGAAVHRDVIMSSFGPRASRPAMSGPGGAAVRKTENSTMQTAIAKPKHLVLLTACIMLATIMQALDTTIANVALPHMQGTLRRPRTRSPGC